MSDIEGIQYLLSLSNSKNFPLIVPVLTHACKHRHVQKKQKEREDIDELKKMEQQKFQKYGNNGNEAEY